MIEFTCNVEEKCDSTQFTDITFPRYYLVYFAAVFLTLRSHSSLLRCFKFSPAVDARWEHAAKTRFCRNLMGPYFQAVLYILRYNTIGKQNFLLLRIDNPGMKQNNSQPNSFLHNYIIPESSAKINSELGNRILVSGLKKFKRDYMYLS